LAASGRGIDVLESKMTANEKRFSMITLKISGKDGAFTVSGTVLGQNEIRIVEINGYEFDVTPAQYMLVARNQDKPGMIGQIGTLLGASRINIANMQVSRNNKEGAAMMFMSVDSEVAKETLNLLQGIDGITQVNLVKL
jgi:D-3-phosphoglycerate dehydrogenase